MANQKDFLIKVYGQDGTTIIKTITTAKPEGSDAIFSKNVPTFRSRINGVPGECVLNLKTSFDDFEEGTTVDFINIVKIYAVKVVDGVQSEDVIYTGYISQYEPFTEPSGDEGVRVTLLSIGSLLSASFYSDGDLTVAHATADPETVARAIIDHFNTVYSGSLLSYSNDTTDPVGSNISITFTDQKWFDCLKKTGELAGTDWWWKIDEAGLYWLKAKPSTPTHSFTIGKHVILVGAVKDMEPVINDVYVRRSGGTETTYESTASQATYGTGSGTPAGKRSKLISDGSLTDVGAADQRGNKEINDNKDARISAELVVSSHAYDIESVKVGETCKIMNFAASSTFFGTNNLLIASVHYLGDSVRLELEKPRSDFGLELGAFVNGS